jgi:hypothetical protein
VVSFRCNRLHVHVSSAHSCIVAAETLFFFSLEYEYEYVKTRARAAHGFYLDILTLHLYVPLWDV